MIDLGTVEIFPVFGAMQKGLIDQDTGLVLLEAQLIMSGLVVPETSEKLSLAESLARNIVDDRMLQRLQELQEALHLIDQMSFERKQLLPVVAAIEEQKISESLGLKILEVHLVTGGFIDPSSRDRISMEKALQKGLITTQTHAKLVSRLRSARDLIDPNTAEKISLTELMQRCIIHQETGLRLFPVKQLAGGMVSLKSGRKVSIFRAVQEGLIDREVTVRLLEAQLFAGGIVDPKTGHRLTVDEAVRHNLIDQDMACALLIRQVQTGGIIDTITGERLTIDEAVEKDLVASRIALVILESLWSFMGLLWPESGEILPVADALEQGLLSTDLACKVLSKRRSIQALFVPETTEILSWKKAVEQGVLERGVAKRLKSIAIPDMMPSMQLAGSPARSKLSLSSAGRGPPGREEQSDSLPRSEDERLMVHLMTHSYINIHNGHKLLLVDGKLNDLTKAFLQAQENGSNADLLEGREETYEELKVLEEVKVTGSAFPEREPGKDLALKQLEIQVAPSTEECKETSPPKPFLDSRKAERALGSAPLEDEVKALIMKDPGQSVKPVSIKSQIDSELGKEQRLATTKAESPFESPRQESVSAISSETKPGEPEEMLVETEKAPGVPILSVDEARSLKLQDRTPEPAMGGVKKDICISVALPETLEKPEIRAEGIAGRVESEVEAEEIGEIGLFQKEETESRSVEGEEIKPPKIGQEEMEERQLEKAQSAKALEVEKQEMKEASVDYSIAEPSLLIRRPVEREGDDTLNMLLAQLRGGGILHEQTGKTLLLNEAVACGVVPSHTAVKVMEEMKMFNGFFDSQTCESLTTNEVINEGLMDEKLLQKVLACDKAVSGVLDPCNNAIYSVKDAAEIGLLDKETAARILEGQVVTGGIVDLKRDKKISVTLASNLGLIEPSSQEDLIKLEKASKGKGTDEAARQKLIGLQAETSGIVDPKTKQPLTVVQSVERGLLDKEKALQLLTKQIADGGIIHHASGMRLSVNNAMKHGLIDQDLCTELLKAESVCLRRYVHPGTEERASLRQAASPGLATPELRSRVQEIQALSGSVFDPVSGGRLTLSQAVKEGLLPELVVEKAMSSSAIKHGIVDPETCMLVPYSELIKKCKIDIESGQRYLEIHPFRAMKDEVTGRTLTCAQAVKLGKADLVPTLRVLQAQADTGGIVKADNGDRLSLKSALEQGLVDVEMARIIASHQMMTGGIVDPDSGERLTLQEAVEKGLISQEVTAALRQAVGLPGDKPDPAELRGGRPQEVVEDVAARQERLAPYRHVPETSAEHTAGSKAMYYKSVGDETGVASEKSQKASHAAVEELLRPLPLETSGRPVVDPPQGKAAAVPEPPSVLVVARPTPPAAAAKMQKKGVRKSKARAKKPLSEDLVGSAVAAQEPEGREGLGVGGEQRFAAKTVPQSSRDKDKTEEAGVREAQVAAAVVSERSQRTGRVEEAVDRSGAVETGPKESICLDQGREKKARTKLKEPLKTAVHKKHAETRLGDKVTGKHPETQPQAPAAESLGGPKMLSGADLKLTEKKKTKKKKAGQGSGPEEATLLEKSPQEKRAFPTPEAKETWMRTIEEELIPSAQEPERETPAEELAGGLLGDLAEQKQTEISEEQMAEKEDKLIALGAKDRIVEDEQMTITPESVAPQETSGEIRNGRGFFAAVQPQERMSQEVIGQEVKDEFSPTTLLAEKKPPALRTGGDRESCVALELEEQALHEMTREITSGEEASSAALQPQRKELHERTGEDSHADQQLCVTTTDGERLQETSEESTKPAKVTVFFLIDLLHVFFFDTNEEYFGQLQLTAGSIYRV